MKLPALVSLLLCLTRVQAYWKVLGLSGPDPDEHRSVPDLITSKGYPAEEHQVTTDDGYILTVHRIRDGRFPRARGQPKPVVFLQHGLLDSSATWVVNAVEQSLAFILADSGFDVWMGNVRGNTYGMQHVSLSPKDAAFWDFSWDEMAALDLPAMLLYALNHTGEQQLFYVGHSQGTMVLFSELSRNPDLASRVRLFCALGPVATVGSIVSPIKYLASMGTDPDHELIYAVFGRRDFLPSTEVLHWLSDLVCNNQVTTPLICDNVIFLFAGPSSNLNNSRIPVYTNHAPAGTSVKNLVHYAQSVLSGRHQMFDYGKHNAAKYNQTTAPLYDVTRVKVPVALYWADKDWLADPADVNYLRKRLPNIVDDFECLGWNHLDFLWATNTDTLLYERMLKLMKSYL